MPFGRFSFPTGQLRANLARGSYQAGAAPVPFPAFLPVSYTHLTYGGEIGSGYCWGKYMLIFRKANIKSKNVVARIYIRDDSIVLRLFLNKVTKHAPYISAAPDHIKNVFIGEYGNCKHCKGDNCKFRKDYQIDGAVIEKCNGCLLYTSRCV